MNLANDRGQRGDKLFISILTKWLASGIDDDYY